MKKQILFLTMLLALIFSASIKSYGQLNVENDFLGGAPTCPAATALTCATGTAIAPVPGVVYPYTITVSDLGTVHWFVTDDPNVMINPSTFTAAIDPGNGTGNYLLTSDAAYNNVANTSLTVNLSWKPFDGNANQVLLVAYTINAAGCTDNIEVYRIVPAYSFTLDLAGLLDAGTPGDTECVGAIQSATYDGTDLNVVYGNNYIFYIVTAANWQTSWEPTFSAATAGVAGSTVSSVEWAYADEATITGAWNATGTPVLASHYGALNGFVGPTGECIVVRVLLDHTLTESLTPELVTLSIDGEMVNPETGTYDGTYPDLDEGNPTCVDDVTDTFVYTITPRATMAATTPAFEPKNP